MLENRDYYCKLALKGGALVRQMFNRRRTSAEILQTYRHILSGDPRPSEFEIPQPTFEAYPTEKSLRAAVVAAGEEACVNS